MGDDAPLLENALKAEPVEAQVELKGEHKEKDKLGGGQRRSSEEEQQQVATPRAGEQTSSETDTRTGTSLSDPPELGSSTSGSAMSRIEATRCSLYGPTQHVP